MKTKTTIIGLLSAVTFLISCSSDEFQEDNQQMEQSKVKFEENQNPKGQLLQDGTFYR